MPWLGGTFLYASRCFQEIGHWWRGGGKGEGAIGLRLVRKFITRAKPIIINSQIYAL